MRKIIIILIYFLIFTSFCFAENEYPVSKSTFDQLYQLGISFNIYVNDLNELFSSTSFSNKQLQDSFKDLQKQTSVTLIWLFTINDMLTIEQIHGQDSQFNLKALKIIRKNIEAFKKHIDSAIKITNQFLSKANDLSLVRQYEKYSDYLTKIDNLLGSLKIELSKSSQIQKWIPQETAKNP